jgi:hypothetical protein
MDEIRSGAARRRRAMKAPGLEVLEGRRLMAAALTQTSIKEVAMKGYTELDIKTASGGDSVTIDDSGTALPGNVTVTLGDGTTYTTKAGVSVVELQGGAGADDVTYNLTGTLTAAQSILLNLGNGNNQFTGNIAGAVDVAAGLDLEVYGGTGNDTMVVNQTGATEAGAFVPYLSGGGGKNTLAYNGTGPIAANASVSPEFAGGSGKDTITSNYSGQDDGNYLYNLTVGAGSGTENITDNVFLAADSTGTVGYSPTQPATIKAGKGNDTISFNVESDPTSTAQVIAAVLGGGGKGSITTSSNVGVQGNVSHMTQTELP